MKKIFRGVLILPFFLTLYSCQKNSTRVLGPLEEKGKSVYNANCISCHNPDPKLIGSVGPDVAFSSLDLITARVMHASYPQGYKAKRTSKLMPELPFLEKEIPALHAYLNSFDKK